MVFRSHKPFWLLADEEESWPEDVDNRRKALVRKFGCGVFTGTGVYALPVSLFPCANTLLLGIMTLGPMTVSVVFVVEDLVVVALGGDALGDIAFGDIAALGPIALAGAGDAGAFVVPGVDENLDEILDSQEFRRPIDGDDVPDFTILPFTTDPASTDFALP